MAEVSLSRRDLNVLQMIQDPESDPSKEIVIDAALPKDPHIHDPVEYEEVSRRERDIIATLSKVEMRMDRKRAELDPEAVREYRRCVNDLGTLISEYPRYASARNNRAQALRRLCGDSMLDMRAHAQPQAILGHIEQSERLAMADMTLSDLDEAISLLSPTTRQTALSPQAAKTLSMAHTQRAAIYHMTSKLLPECEVSVDASRREAAWNKLDFEAGASRDFALGGLYGNNVAKGLAVSMNPTAKLCGQMVKEAMAREYGSDFAQ